MSDSLMVSSGTITSTNTGTFITPTYYYDESSPNINDWGYKLVPMVGEPQLSQKKKGGDDMRYLYEVILVNPKDDEFEICEVVAKSETSALMTAYGIGDFSDITDGVPFDDLETQCRILMSWEKVGE